MGADAQGVEVRQAAPLTNAFVATDPLDVFGVTWLELYVVVVTKSTLVQIDVVWEAHPSMDDADGTWTRVPAEGTATAGVVTLSDYEQESAVASNGQGRLFRCQAFGRRMRASIKGDVSAPASSVSAQAFRR